MRRFYSVYLSRRKVVTAVVQDGQDKQQFEVWTWLPEDPSKAALVSTHRYADADTMSQARAKAVRAAKDAAAAVTATSVFDLKWPEIRP